ncbi:MAG: PTS lactose/cellobiose transporter subunit IIA [Erysipelotrichaceae bacterium]|jgi:PTS system cellobiose-specific IIA component|nr:PTS lactose/cellobiose transporter subunit IIA [Erysipelotrichaceae bacterium]
MSVKEEMQMLAFQMIAGIGTAKSMYLEAVELAKEGKYEQAKAHLEEGKALYAEAAHSHLDLLAKEANGEDLPFSLIFMHAEDQLLSTETIGLICEEHIALYEKIDQLSKK